MQDNKADLIINYYVDDILEKVMNILEIEIPTYNEADNPMLLAETSIIDWTIQRKDVLALEKIFKAKCKGVKKKRVLIKNKRNSLELVNGVKQESEAKPKLRKLSMKDDVKENEELCEIKTEITEQRLKEENVNDEKTVI